jgi:hypothetical protein
MQLLLVRFIVVKIWAYNRLMNRSLLAASLTILASAICGCSMGGWEEPAPTQTRQVRTAGGGLVVGKPCPKFAFTTTEGKKVTPASLNGKAFIIDIWSMT